jgi:hypothetical protein
MPAEANYGLEQRRSTERLTPSTNGVVVDPPDGKLPYQPWARAERIDRERPAIVDMKTPQPIVSSREFHARFDTPSPFQIIQTPGYVVPSLRDA